MERFSKYLAAVDGSNGWDTVGPLFYDAFDPDCVVITADGEYDRDGWAAMAKGLVDKGASASGFEITREEGETAYYHVTVNVPGAEPMRLTAVGTLRDGRMVRVEPVDPAAYASLVERSK